MVRFGLRFVFYKPNQTESNCIMLQPTFYLTHIYSKPKPIIYQSYDYEQFSHPYTYSFSLSLLKFLLTLSCHLRPIHLVSSSLISTLLYSFFFTFSFLCKFSLFQFCFIAHLYLYSLLSYVLSFSSSLISHLFYFSVSL